MTRSQRCSPKITHISWGNMEVEGLGKGRDFKLFPGGGRDWDWTETNTHHIPGIQPADVQELIDKGSEVVVLTRGLSQLVRATDNNDPANPTDDSTVTDAYDSLSRLIEETQQIGTLPVQVVSSGWRAENLRSRLVYPNGRVVEFTYDDLDRLQTVGDQGAALPIVVYNYIGDRVLDRLYSQNGTRMTYLDNSGTVDVGYDGLARPVELRHLRADNSLIVGFAHGYDRMNNKRFEEKLHAPNDSELYGYDSAYRLVSFQRGTLNGTKDAIAIPSAHAPIQTTWTLDGAGNAEQIDGEIRQHSTFNETTQRDGTQLKYDDNGNLVEDGQFLYKWDFKNRLFNVTRKADGLLVATNSYDALGRRIRKVVTNSGVLNSTTDFYLDGLREIEEHDGNNALLQQYVYGRYIDEVLVLDRNTGGGTTATGVGDQRLFYHQNTLASVFALTDMTAKIVEGYLYEAYGRQWLFLPGANALVDFGSDDVVLLNGASLFGNPFLFTGRRLDPETGLLYYRARYMQPELNTFLSRWTDNALDLNLYRYQFNRPTFVTDPHGDPAPLVVLAVAGRAALKYITQRAPQLAVATVVETGLEWGLARLVGDTTFDPLQAFKRNAVVNFTVGWIPGVVVPENAILTVWWLGKVIQSGWWSWFDAQGAMAKAMWRGRHRGKTRRRAEDGPALANDARIEAWFRRNGGSDGASRRDRQRC